MEWVRRSPQIHSIFANLGFVHKNGYQVYDNCNAALETILHNILTEDRYLRTYRRSIGFGENIRKDLIPLLIHAEEETTIELLVKILVNLTLPVECLLAMEITSLTDNGRLTVYELNNVLTAAKAAFTDPRTTKVILDFSNKILDNKQTELSTGQCTNVGNCLLLLRNLLHIPEDNSGPRPKGQSRHPAQNQIVWNIFSQSIDKILLKLIVMPEASNWSVTIVELLSLLYKDQHVITLHKLLHQWQETSLFESSDDNESNTSLQDRGRGDASPMLTSGATSELSDTGGSGKSNDVPKSANNGRNSTSLEAPADNKATIEEKINPIINTIETQYSDNEQPDKNDEDKKKSEQNSQSQGNQTELKNENAQLSVTSSDGYGMQTENQESMSMSSNEYDISTKKPVYQKRHKYGTLIENQESITTSSNEDDILTKMPVHKKPHNPKRKIKNKPCSEVLLQNQKQKKVFKRTKPKIFYTPCFSYKTPTDDDITHIMKEFTKEFLLNGYNSLVETLHIQILTNVQLEIDRSHFFWLVTYFLKFVTQLKLDLEHVSYVLSYEIVSYLTAEGVNLCEQFEWVANLYVNDSKPALRRLHLLVTAIRELVQAIEVYKKNGIMCKIYQQTLLKLQIKICKTEELRSLLVLLMRHYNPKYHSKQYLQDLIVINHFLLMFLDEVIMLPDFSGTNYILDHIRQFVTPVIMSQYGLMLEDFAVNGEFVNDCIFLMMHHVYHVSGELDCLISLFQPKILKTFRSIRMSEFEICDVWSNLIENIISMKPKTLQSKANFSLDTENLEDDKMSETPVNIKNSQNRWTKAAFLLKYMQFSPQFNKIEEIIKLHKDNDMIKLRDSAIKELLKQNIITNEKYEEFLQAQKKMSDDEIAKVCDQLTQDGKSKFLDWVQKVLLDTCFAKVYVEKKKNNQSDASTTQSDIKLLNFEMFKKKPYELSDLSPVSYHSIMLSQSVPLVPWNCEQGNVVKDMNFLQLLHKLGFHIPNASEKSYIRIPNLWTAKHLYEAAIKISPIDNSKLKFSLDEVINGATHQQSCQQNSFLVASDLTSNAAMIEKPVNLYQIHTPNLATLVNFTPMPGSSFNPQREEMTKLNWRETLEMSQENTMPIESRILEKGERATRMDAAMQKKVTEETTTATPLLQMEAARCTPTPIGSSFVNVKWDDSNFNQAESEYYNDSVSETASIAADLAMMYVSDHDDEDVPLRPVTDGGRTLDDQLSSDSDDVIAKKRPRV